MSINLEINEYHTATQLIFYENDVSLLQAFDNTTYDLQETKKKKMKNEINCVMLIVHNVDQCDRLEGRKENLLAL